MGLPPARTVALVLVLAVLAASAGAGWAFQRRGEHQATAVVMLHPLSGNAYSPVGQGDELVNLETEAQVLRSEAVARAVLDRLGTAGDPDDLLAAVQVRVPPNTQLLEITSAGPDDDTALARASAFAEVFLAFRRARTESAVFEQTSRLEELVEERSGERTAAIARMEQVAPDSSQRRVLEQQVEELTLQISSLRAQLVTAESESLDPGQVVTPGRVQSPGPLADPVVVASVAAVAVLLGAVGAAAIRAGRGRVDALGSIDDLADLPPPALGAVHGAVGADDEVVALVRTSVLAATTARPRVVVVARADRGESAIHGPLLTALVRARYHVVSLDLHRREDVVAIGQLVLDEVAVDDVLVEQEPLTGRLQPAGRRPTGDAPALGDLVAAAGMARSLQDLAKRTDVVLVRCPGLATPVGRALLTAASSAVVEVSPSRTTRSDVERALDGAARADCEVLGIVEVRDVAVRSAQRGADAHR